MTPIELLAAFETLAEAPDGVARLRELVLSLAVRGKLVAQDPGEEPASELLRKAVDGVSDGGARSTRQRHTLEWSSSAADEAFLLPNGWTWTTTSHLGVTSPRNRALDEDEASFVPMPMIPTKWGGALRFEVKGWGTVKRGYTHIADGDIVFAKITPCFQNGKACVVKGLRNGIGAGTTELHVLRPDPGVVVPEYMLIFYRSPQFVLGGMATLSGTAGQQRVSTEYFCETPVPLPPLAEQHRIVARVDELMRLLDRLEAVRNRRDEVRRAARDAALAALRDAPDAEAVEAAWTRISGEIHALFARPEDVAPLRQAVLQLAVRGRLVKQDPGEEPKEPGHSAEVKTSDVIPFGIPSSWRWLRVGQLGDMLSGATPAKDDPTLWNGQIPWVSPKDMKRPRIKSAIDFVTAEALQGSSLKLVPVGALLVVVRGMILIHSFPVAVTDVEVTINQDMKAIIPTTGDSLDYLLLLIQGSRDRVLALVERSTHGTCKLPIASLSSLLLPIPPLAEQHRIVAKVDALMAICDAIEARLTTARTLHSQAAAAAVHHLDV